LSYGAAFIIRVDVVNVHTSLTYECMSFCQVDSLFDILVYVSDIWSFTTSTLMMQTEDILETLVFNSALARLTAREDFIAFTRREIFKFYEM
jgi:hypothetical protein